MFDDYYFRPSSACYILRPSRPSLHSLNSVLSRLDTNYERRQNLIFSVLFFCTFSAFGMKILFEILFSNDVCIYEQPR